MTARYAGAMLILAAVAAASSRVWGGWLAPGQMRGALIGLGLATLGAVTGLLLTAWSFDKGPRAFFSALAIGILGRLFLYGAALMWVAVKTSIDPTATAVALLVSYVVFQVIEVRFALRGLGRPNA